MQVWRTISLRGLIGNRFFPIFHEKQCYVLIKIFNFGPWTKSSYHMCNKKGNSLFNKTKVFWTRVSCWPTKIKNKTVERPSLCVLTEDDEGDGTRRALHSVRKFATSHFCNTIVTNRRWLDERGLCTQSENIMNWDYNKLPRHFVHRFPKRKTKLPHVVRPHVRR